ncbi:hypothetical protein D3C78_1178280 [compost metagenome]
MYFSMNTPESLKLFCPRRLTASKASDSSAAERHTRMPMPPPPAVLFSITG